MVANAATLSTAGRLLILLAVGVFGASAYGASDGGAELAAEANAAYTAQRWGDAAQLYERRVEAVPDSARDWYRLGVALRHIGTLSRALEAFAQARKHGVPAAMVDVDVARTHALAGETKQAIEALRNAVAAGFANPSILIDTPELLPLRASDEYDALIAQARDNKTPCARRAAFRQFDFWVGDWQVHDAQGTLQGTNRISLREGDCYLFEEWTGASGSTGSSINYYDAARSKWVQHWISAGGSQIQIEGGLDDDGSMRLVGRIHYLSTGQSAAFRGLWTPLDDGRVRQFFEQSTDGGQTWASWFEGFYTRSAPSDPDTEQDG